MGLDGPIIQLEALRWSLESEDVDQRCTHRWKLLLVQLRDQRADIAALHDSDPLGFEHARRGQSVLRSERYLPREATDLRGKRDHRNLSERRQSVRTSKHEHRPTLVW